MTTLREKLLPEDGGVVSLVGAGGKTTLMFRLAKELLEVGETVLTTTTTKIMMPAREKSSHVIVSSRTEQAVAEARELLKDSLHVTVGREHLIPQNKLSGFEPDAIGRFWKTGLFRWILVEADGAAQRPLKAPAAHEPVIPECSTLVVAVVGLDAVGESLNDQWVFRPDIYSQLADIPLNSPITENSVVAMILDDNGMMKGCPPTARRCVFLNKAEEDHTFAAGRTIATILHKKGGRKFDRILIGSVKREPPFAKVYVPEID
jgi:probable selenium-dependent hydroxylase accessory protein YqeC